jgi:Ni,Fe-hydrogenase I small subunit
MFFHKGSFHVSVSSITRGYVAAGSVAGGIPPDEEKIAHLTVAPRSICCCNRQMSTVNLALLAVGSCGELGCAIAVASEKTKVRLIN